MPCRYCFFFLIFCLMMHVSYCVYVLQVASLFCHCTIFIVNLLFCCVLGKQISLSGVGREWHITSGGWQVTL